MLKLLILWVGVLSSQNTPVQKLRSKIGDGLIFVRVQYHWIVSTDTNLLTYNVWFSLDNECPLFRVNRNDLVTKVILCVCDRLVPVCVCVC